MQFPESWLRELVNPDLDTQALSERLTMAGLEVEHLAPVAPPFDKVVVGEIVGIAPHPNADRLRVCQVNVGAEVPLGIVCGAPNAALGMKAPCALVGAVLPPAKAGDTPLRITPAKLRGVESAGMLCSARELGLSTDHSGLMSLDAGAHPGEDIRAHLGLDDQIFTIKLTPNRADCLSLLGIARDVAALTGAPLCLPTMTPVPAQHARGTAVHVHAPDGCGRFALRRIEGVDATRTTPEWMRRKLERCGLRSISPLVDITNYVMLLLGQPMHVFDAARVRGDLHVRWAQAGENLKLLSGADISLAPDLLVIADDSGPVSLAGIMGGDSTKASEQTRDVLFEAAFWFPRAIMGRAKRFQFGSDASHRFERGVDYELCAQAVELATHLALELCGGSPGPLLDQRINLPTRMPVSMRLARAAKVIGGGAVDTQACIESFTRLGFEPQLQDSVVTITPPSHRFDLSVEEDLIEEYARCHGFDHIPVRPSDAPLLARALPETQLAQAALRERLTSLGYTEAVSFSFVEAAWETELHRNAAPIRVLNPIASQQSVMRSSLLASMLMAAHYNVARKQPLVRLFELAKTYRRDATISADNEHVDGIAQHLKLAGVAVGAAYPAQWGYPKRVVDFFDVKGDLAMLFGTGLDYAPCQDHPMLHPGRAAYVQRGGVCLGVLGELSPALQKRFDMPAETVLFELDWQGLAAMTLPHAAPIPRQQPLTRDLSLIVPQSLPHDQLVQTSLELLRQLPLGQQVRDVTLFDLYHAETTSVALRLTFEFDQPQEESDIAATVQHLLHGLEQRLGARLKLQS